MEEHGLGQISRQFGNALENELNFCQQLHHEQTKPKE